MPASIHSNVARIRRSSAGGAAHRDSIGRGRRGSYTEIALTRRLLSYVLLLATAARAEKIIVIPAGDNVARVLPPLIIAEAEIAEGLKRLDAACRHFESQDAVVLNEAGG